LEVCICQQNAGDDILSGRRLDRFSQIYLFGGPQLDDSKRFRTRLSGLYWAVVGQHASVNYEVIQVIHRECGVEIQDYGEYRSVTKLIEKGEMRDVLDTISLTYRVITRSRRYPSNEIQNWIAEISRYFREENLSYKLDENCVVQRFIDEEFQLTSAAALQGLSLAQLSPAKEALKRGLACLTNVHQDTKGAVVAVFEACEIVAKNLIPEAQNLNAKLCKERLALLCMTPNAGETELKVETGVFSAMAEWVNAVHNYRHGQAEAEVVAPNLELAVQLVSMGCTFTRRLSQAYESRTHLDRSSTR